VKESAMQEQPAAAAAAAEAEAEAEAVPPVTVPAMAIQAGEAQTQQRRRRVRWAWVEASIWTDRMLAALETGVKGGVWYSLIDKVYSPKNLWSSWAKAAKNHGAPGVDGITIDRYEKDVEVNLERLSGQLKAGQYQPRAIRRTLIPKADGSKRPLGIPTVGDRIVQGAVRHAIEPIFEQRFAQHSYGFRPGRGCKAALRRVDELLKSGHRYAVDADLKGYFDSIPHDLLMKQVATGVADSRVLKLIRAFLEANIMDGLAQWTPTAGAPQGAVLSPLLSNIYLDPLDHLMAAGNGYEMVRYADDFVILCRTMQEAEAALAEVKRWTVQAGLTLHPEKTRLIDTATQAMEFLGYRFDKGRRWPRHKSVMKLRDTIRRRTQRTGGVSLKVTIHRINPVLRGWFGYFKHASGGMRQVDGWVRQRLRSILRHHHKRPGRSGVADYQRWPNAFFVRMGLFSLESAHRLARQSMKMAH
jgi:RNA-directed DNA polymerase